MRTLRSSALVLLAAPFTVGGCGLVLGLGGFEDATSTGTTSTTGAGGSGHGGSGGTTHAGGAGGTAHAGGAGGAAHAGGAGGTAHAGGAGGATHAGGIGGGTGCTPLEQQNCYTAGSSTLQGPCHPGKKTCNQQGTAWGACEGEVTPAAQDDCVGLVDANCDGKVECACKAGDTQPCYDGAQGTDKNPPCKPGSHTCKQDGSGWDACVGEVVPQAETCGNQIDDNCDGVVDEWCTCKAQGTQACYDGPAPTRNVGDCKDGTQLCNANGNGWDACTGEVLPKPEQCDVKGDEDCDGIACSEPLWGELFQSGGSQAVNYNGVAADAAGNTFVIGDYDGGINFGNGVSPSAASGSFLAKVDPTGKALWAVSAIGSVIAVDKDDHVYVGGSGGLSAFDGSKNGNVLWTVPITNGNVRALAVAPGVSGLVLGGSYSGVLTIGAKSAPQSINDDAFVALVSLSNGAPTWIRALGDAPGKPASQQYVNGVAVDVGGYILIAGTFWTSALLAGSSYVSNGSSDAFVGKIDTNSSNVLWVKVFGSAAGDSAAAVAVDSSGAAIAVGQVGGTADFGLGQPIAGHGLGDAFVVKFAGGTGTTQWAHVYGGAASEMASSVAVDAADDIVLTGMSYGSSVMTFGGSPYTFANGGVFLAKLDTNGGYRWSRFSGDGNQDAPHLAIPKGGKDIFLELYDTGAVDLGTGPLASKPNLNDAFVLYRFQP